MQLPCIVMPYQFGTNWAGFIAKTGNILGPLLGYEVLVAFFLEASFLGIMIFGWKKVGKKLHFISTCLVAIGTIISAFWILAANSWMQTPTGYILGADNVFYPKSWLEIIFNPSFPHRFFHMIVAVYITTAFCVMGIAGYFFVIKKSLKHAKILMTLSVFFIAVMVPLQIFIGDSQGLNTRKYQPKKIAAIEAVWKTEKGVGLTIFGWPNQKKMKTEYAIKIPYLASIILTHSIDGELQGMNEWDKNDIPPVAPVFFGFRVMVGIGLLMLLTAFIGIYKFFRGTLFLSTTFHKWTIFMSPLGFVAILAGWYVTEIGRQPYVVYNLLRTSDVVSPVAAHNVLFSLILFVISYFFMLSFGLYYSFKTIKKGINTSEISEEIEFTTKNFKKIFLKPYTEK